MLELVYLQYLPAEENRSKHNKRDELYELTTQVLSNEFYNKYYNTFSEQNII